MQFTHVVRSTWFTDLRFTVPCKPQFILKRITIHKTVSQKALRLCKFLQIASLKMYAIAHCKSKEKIYGNVESYRKELGFTPKEKCYFKVRPTLNGTLLVY